MPHDSETRRQVLDVLREEKRGLTEPEIKRRTGLSAGDLRVALRRLVREGEVQKRQGRYLAPQQAEEDGPAAPDTGPLVEPPVGMDVLRRLCRFHADVVREVTASKVEFENGARELSAQLLTPVDWHQLAQGEVTIRRSDLPMSLDLAAKGRVVFCGPLHRVERKKGPVWLPVFLIHAQVVREAEVVRFQRDGGVDLNLSWCEEFYSAGEEDALEDLMIRLRMMKETEPGVIQHAPVSHFGECWRSLADRAPEHPWIRKRDPLVPGEEVRLSGTGPEGIQPVVLLFTEKASKFTGGLIQDLRSIAEATDEDLACSALSSLLDEPVGGEPSGRAEEGVDVLVEFSTLNPIQSDAVREALNTPLTVIQGPPGTGKSTVVRSTLLTAGVQRRPAIFGSTNHKAVDAVVGAMNERVEDGTLVADLRDGMRWTGHLLHHLEAGRSAEGLDLEVFLGSLKDLEAEIEVILVDTRRSLELGDRMVEIQERLSLLAEEHGPWAERIAAAALPLTPSDARLRSSELAGSEWWRRLLAIWHRWRLARRLHRAWPDPDRPPRASLGALLDGKLDLVDLNEVEGKLEALPSLDDRAEALVDKVEDKADRIEGVLPALPAAWAERVRDQGEAISEVRREAQGSSRLARENRDRVEKKRLRQLLPGLPLWTITNLSARREVPLVAGAFDLAIIDEAGQCNPASVLPLLFRARRAMFVGDPQQLRPVGSLARHKEDQLRRRYGFEGPEFSRFTFTGRSAYDLAQDALIARRGRAFLLREHYRCHPAIAEFFNEHFYDGNLIVRTTGREAAVRGSGIGWTHVDGGSITHGSSRWHSPQVEAMVEELRALAGRGFDGTVGVVTPFREHAKRVRDLAHQRLGAGKLAEWKFISETADGFQGGERDLILFGLVGGGEGPSRTPRFYLRDRNRFNVAVSRAKNHLHVFGDEAWVEDCGVPILTDLLSAARACRDRPTDAVRRDLIGPVWEPRLAEALHLLGVEFRQQYPAQGYHLDFAFFPPDGRKVNVEVDGETYHRDRNGNLRAEDVRRDLVLRADGWTVQRFWVYQLREDWDSCLRRIQRLLSPP